jgi:hypothetical protein
VGCRCISAVLGEPHLLLLLLLLLLLKINASSMLVGMVLSLVRVK